MLDRAWLEEQGFEGFRKISCLKSCGCTGIPAVHGVYVVYRERLDKPDFLPQSIGGHFRGHDPTVPIEVLCEQWVRNAHLLNIGQTSRSLRSRISRYIKFGQGLPVAKWGGRYIWQLVDSDTLVIAWKPTGDEDARAVERRYIAEFEACYGRLPFANLRR